MEFQCVSGCFMWFYLLLRGYRGFQKASEGFRSFHESSRRFRWGVKPFQWVSANLWEFMGGLLGVRKHFNALMRFQGVSYDPWAFCRRLHGFIWYSGNFSVFQEGFNGFRRVPE